MDNPENKPSQSQNMPEAKSQGGFKRILRIMLFLLLAFLVGKYSERFFNGRWYTLGDEIKFPSNIGEFKLQHVSETQGFPFLDPGDSIIKWTNSMGLETTIYRSKRVFQEQWPWVDKEQLKIDGRHVQWTDGVNRYTLRIDEYGPPPIGSTQPATLPGPLP